MTSSPTSRSGKVGGPRRFSAVDELIFKKKLLIGLKKLNDWPTYPQLIVKGELVGGLDIVKEMVENGEFRELVA